MNGLEKDQGQVQAPVLTNTQDLFIDFCQMRDEIMAIYQEMYGTLFVNTNLALINVHPLQALLPTIPSIPPTGLNRYIIEAESFKL